MTMEMVNIEYDIEKDAFIIYMGIFDENDNLVAEVSSPPFEIKDLKKMPNFKLIEKVLLDVRKDALSTLN
jgi:hypothetical protein